MLPFKNTSNNGKNTFNIFQTYSNYIIHLISFYFSGTHWNGAIEHCVSIEFLLQYGDEGVKEKLQAVQYKHSQLTAQQSLR